MNSNNGEVVVRLLNPREETVTVHKGTKVAELEQVESVGAANIELAETGSQTGSQTGEISREKQELLQDLAATTSKSLAEEETQKLHQLLLTYHDVFAGSSDEMGRTDLLKHAVHTNETPIRQAVRRLPPQRREEVHRMLQDMLQRDIIQPSKSPWASPIVLVQKKDGTFCFCADYRKLNAVTRKDAYPLPRIDDTLDTLASSRLFSTLDLASGYWQVELDEDARQKTAFCNPSGLFEFKVMPFGLCNAPATFQRLMDLVLAGLHWSHCLVYIDDIVILGRSYDEHLANLGAVFARIRDAGLKLQPAKCAFLQKQVRYLGHIVSEEGVAVDPTKVDKVAAWPIPTSAREVLQFLGLASFYRRFISNFATIAKPLHRLTERTTTFQWTTECEEAFNSIPGLQPILHP